MPNQHMALGEEDCLFAIDKKVALTARRQDDAAPRKRARPKELEKAIAASHRVHPSAPLFGDLAPSTPAQGWHGAIGVVGVQAFSV